MANKIEDFINAKINENKDKSSTIVKQWFEHVVITDIYSVSDKLEVFECVDPKTGEICEIRRPKGFRIEQVKVGDIVTGGWQHEDDGSYFSCTKEGEWND